MNSLRTRCVGEKCRILQPASTRIPAAEKRLEDVAVPNVWNHREIKKPAFFHLNAVQPPRLFCFPNKRSFCDLRPRASYFGRLFFRPVRARRQWRRCPPSLPTFGRLSNDAMPVLDCGICRRRTTSADAGLEPSAEESNRREFRRFRGVDWLPAGKVAPSARSLTRSRSAALASKFRYRKARSYNQNATPINVRQQKFLACQNCETLPVIQIAICE